MVMTSQDKERLLDELIEAVYQFGKDTAKDSFHSVAEYNNRTGKLADMKEEILALM